MQQVFICMGCGARFERRPTRGQRPKWCAGCRDRKRTERACAHCGRVGTRGDARFCSRFCSIAAARRVAVIRPRPIKPPPADRRSPLRKAIEERDASVALAEIRSRCELVDGCWIWPRVHNGYPIVRLGKGGQSQPLHRLVVELAQGGPLGSQHAHHVCATPACVNPDHLQPITHRENVAEMLARQSYLARIRELEAALAEADPCHPLLDVVKVA